MLCSNGVCPHTATTHRNLAVAACSLIQACESVFAEAPEVSESTLNSTSKSISNSTSSNHTGWLYTRLIIKNLF